MMLTGKAKEMFEGWYLKLPNAMGLNYGAFDITMNRFYCLPESMQFGVYQDWADSIGYEISTHITIVGGLLFGYNIRLIEDDSEKGGGVNYPTRQEARNAAIEKLNEIINKR